MPLSKNGDTCAQDLLHHVLEEAEREEVVADIAGAVHQSAVGVALLCHFQGDLTVLQHPERSVHRAHHPNMLRGEVFFHYLMTQNMGGGGAE